MNLSICLSGKPKFFKKSFFYIKNNLIDNFDNLDFFLHCWETDITDYDKQEIINLYNPKKYLFEKEKIHILNYPFKQSTILPNNVFSMFYSIMKSNELKKEYEQENNMNYDWVFRLRFDFALNKFFNNDILKNLDGSSIYLNNFEKSPNPHCADCFAFSTSKNMDIYCETYKNLMKYGYEGITLSGESMLYKQLISHEINLKEYDINHPFQPDDLGFLSRNPEIKGLLCKNSLIRDYRK
jgi:hypothetical protein